MVAVSLKMINFESKCEETKQNIESLASIKRLDNN